MKKNLLIFTLIMPFLAFSQNKDAYKWGNPVTGEPQSLKANEVSSDFHTFDSMVSTRPVNDPPADNKRGIISYNFIKVGSTFYDLQTNASMGRRIFLHPDGKVSIVWTTSTDAAFNNRGTGYNHYNLSNWLTVANPTPRIEGIRLGWPSIGVNGTKEWVMGHDAASGGFIMSTNASIGSTSWTSGNSILDETNRRPIWGRIMNNGNIFHCIASYADSAQVGEPRAPEINGVFAPMTYSRSTDGGQTWSIQHSLLPGYDSSRFNSGGGDVYAMDVRDSIVAIVTGDHFKDVTLWKSTDNGLTFTKIICDTFKYAPYTSKAYIPDTPYFVCDGSLDVLIDNDGKVHTFWGVSGLNDVDTTDELISFYFGTGLLGYWNEISKTSQFIASGMQFDRNNNKRIDISAGNRYALENGQVPAVLKNNGISSVARLGRTSYLHMPSAGIDDDGRIFVTFSYPLEMDVDANNINLRDIMIVHSNDNGATWEKPQDVTQIQGFEEEFGCVARRVDDFVHLVFQKDATGGTNLQNNSTVDNNHPSVVNDIMYAAIPVAKILDSSIQTLWNNVGIDRFDANKEVFVVSQNFPNPFSNSSEVLIWLSTTSEVSVEITNISGQVISTESYGELGAGNHQLTMNGDGLSTGVYFYTVKTSTHSVTRKMTITN